MNNYIF